MDNELLITEINYSFFNMIFISTDFSYVTFTDITVQFPCSYYACTFFN